MIKTMADICPHCGSAFTRPTTTPPVFDVGYDQMTGEAKEMVTIGRKCNECNTMFFEYHWLDYAGYSCNGKSYDAEGEEE